MLDASMRVDHPDVVGAIEISLDQLAPGARSEVVRAVLEVRHGDLPRLKVGCVDLCR